MFLVYTKNNTGSTCHMFNLLTTHNVLSCGVIQLNKTYGEYVSRKEHTKTEIYALQSEENSDKWSNFNIDPVKTEDIKTEKLED